MKRIFSLFSALWNGKKAKKIRRKLAKFASKALMIILEKVVLMIIKHFLG
jgi:hypothetical protein